MPSSGPFSKRQSAETTETYLHTYTVQSTFHDILFLIVAMVGRDNNKRVSTLGLMAMDNGL